MARKLFYLIQKINTATVRNERFGETHLHYFGKNDKCLFTDGDSTAWYNFNQLTPYFVEEYGYKRKCDAARNWTYKNPQIGEPYWKADVRIVEAWVREDGKVLLTP